MSNQNKPIKELVITRQYNAPREIVFKAWTDPKEIAKWWGPKGFTNLVWSWDSNPGGEIYVVMQGPDGTDHPMTGQFLEIVKPEKIVFSAKAFADDKGDAKLEVLNTITFKDLDGKTELTLRAVVTKLEPEAQAGVDGMNEGWSQSLDRLEFFTVPEKAIIHIERIFNAPREMVYKAWTDIKHLQKWYAPNNCEVYFSKVDVRKGGSYICCIKNPQYGDCWAIANFFDVQEPSRLVFNLSRCDENGNILAPELLGMDKEWPQDTLVTLTFDDLGNGKTKMTLTQTVSLALAKKTGAYPSWLEMFDRLEKEIL